MMHIDPISLLRPAGGSVDALRQLAATACTMAVEQHCPIAAIEALTFARLAAAQGKVCDQGGLLSVIACVSQTFGAEYPEFDTALSAESIAWVSHLAERGEDVAGDLLGAMVEHSSPEATALSIAYRKRIQNIERA